MILPFCSFHLNFFIPCYNSILSSIVDGGLLLKRLAVFSFTVMFFTKCSDVDVLNKYVVGGKGDELLRFIQGKSAGKYMELLLFYNDLSLFC